jgi:hypothetical protein
VEHPDEDTHLKIITPGGQGKKPILRRGLGLGGQRRWR